jgi:hypothetical protein
MRKKIQLETVVHTLLLSLISDVRMTPYRKCKNLVQIPRIIVVVTSTVGYATTNERYNEQFLSIKSGCYNENRCYNERGGP